MEQDEAAMQLNELDRRGLAFSGRTLALAYHHVKQRAEAEPGHSKEGRNRVVGQRSAAVEAPLARGAPCTPLGPGAGHHR